VRLARYSWEFPLGVLLGMVAGVLGYAIVAWTVDAHALRVLEVMR